MCEENFTPGAPDFGEITQQQARNDSPVSVGKNPRQKGFFLGNDRIHTNPTDVLCNGNKITQNREVISQKFAQNFVNLWPIFQK